MTTLPVNTIPTKADNSKFLALTVFSFRNYITLEICLIWILYLQRFTKGDLVFLALQVSNAQCYLKEKSLLHRDIAARNCV